MEMLEVLLQRNLAYYYLSGPTVTYSLSNRVDIAFEDDVTRQFRIGGATYNYYE